MPNKLRVLLTGGCGYIGSHTAVELMRAGHEVVIADNLVNSSASVLPRIEELGGARPVFYNIDVCDPAALDALLRAERIDAVIHFAGLKCVPESVEKPTLYYRNNLTSTMNLLERMKEHGVKYIVFSSSATVYGEQDTMPLREDMPTGACTNPYGMTKHMSEVIIRDTARADHELGAVLLRYFNPIGADESGRIGEDPQGIPNNLLPYVAQFATGRRERLFVNGNDYPTRDGTCIRDYIHVTDLAIAHIKALEFIVGKSGCEVFNIGTGNGYSVLEVIKAFERATGMTINYKIVGRREGDIEQIWADPSYSNAELGWKAERTLDEMVASAWKWEQHYRKE